VLTVAL